MTQTANQDLLEALLDSWERNNTILLNVLQALPEGGLEARALPGSPSVAVQFSHMHSTRLFFVSQTAPEFAKDIEQLFRQDGEQWLAERDPKRIAQGLNSSAKAVRDAMQNHLLEGQPMKSANVSYDHPILLLQHVLWHEGYHIGQIMLALKASGHPMTDEQTAPLIWDVWRHEEWPESEPA